jgi:hypothetical protein
MSAPTAAWSTRARTSAGGVPEISAVTRELRFLIAAGFFIVVASRTDASPSELTAIQWFRLSGATFPAIHSLVRTARRVMKFLGHPPPATPALPPATFATESCSSGATPPSRYSRSKSQVTIRSRLDLAALRLMMRYGRGNYCASAQGKSRATVAFIKLDSGSAAIGWLRVLDLKKELKLITGRSGTSVWSARWDCVSIPGGDREKCDRDDNVAFDCMCCPTN